MNHPVSASPTTGGQAVIAQHLAASMDVKRALMAEAELLRDLEALAEQCLQALRTGHKIIFAGNGGSFGDAQHLSAEFTSRLQFDRAPLASIALGTNASSMSAIGNDYGYEQVFAREIQALALPGDVFIPITTSGNSPNIVAAVAVAKQRGIHTVAWTGQTGGKLRGTVPLLAVPSTETMRIQECHILLGHILCALVETAYFGSPAEAR